MIQNIIQRLTRFFDNPLIPWKKLIISFKLGNFALEKWLLLRQYRIYQKTTRPKELENEVDQETFDKSQSYGRAKAKFKIISETWSLLEDLAFIHYDLFPKIWQLVGLGLARYAPDRFSGEITQSLCFGYAFFVVSLIVGLPFDYYYNFILEESYGFNKMTVKLWLTDMVKSQFLAIAFGGPISAAILAIVQRTGQNFFYYLWLFMLGVNMLAITIYPIFIVPLFNKLTPLPPGALKEGVESLARKLNFPLTELQVIDGSKRSAHSNAYFSGLPWKKHIVIYDTLLEKSTDKEVEAVLAHELGHWSHSHTTKLLLIGQAHIFYVFAFFSVFYKNKSLFADFGFTDEMPIAIGFLLFGEVFSPTDAVVKVLMNMMSRSMEYQADEFAAKLGYTATLGSSLIKLQIQNLSSMDADWMYSSYHYSHPILVERLRAINWHASDKVTAGKGSSTALDKDNTDSELRPRQSNGRKDEL